MFNISQCNCENTHQNAVAKWRLEHPETKDLPYRDVVTMVNWAKIERDGKLSRAQRLHPGDLSYGLFNRRIFDDNRYLRFNDGRQPSEMVVTTPEGEISFDMTFIPTLAYEALPLSEDGLRAKAWDILLERTGQSLEETLLLKAVFDTRSLVPFFNPLFKAAAHLLPRFDPLCSNCPARANGDCIPSVVSISDLEELKQNTWGFVQIERHLIFPGDKH